MTEELERLVEKVAASVVEEDPIFLELVRHLERLRERRALTVLEFFAIHQSLQWSRLATAVRVSKQEVNADESSEELARHINERLGNVWKDF
jgi:hypothetical protein